MEKLKQCIADSQCVLIGIGNEFKNDEIDKELLEIYMQKKKKEETDSDWMLSYMQSQGLNKEKSEKYLKAYQQIYELVKDKNYFVVTLNEDDLIFQSPFDSQKITAPCGSYHRLQCSNGCEESLMDAEEVTAQIVDKLKDQTLSLSQIVPPICKKCGQRLVLNVVEEENYMEQGYIESWKKYRMWLTGTLNKKICLLELGTDFKYPSIIRWAFEKVAFLNEKAVLFRINEKYPQLTEELKGKAYSYPQNAVDFFTAGNE